MDDRTLAAKIIAMNCAPRAQARIAAGMPERQAWDEAVAEFMAWLKGVENVRHFTEMGEWLD